MSQKRTAGSELNHDNWNEEEEKEDSGQFKKASDDVLQNRVRKIAKRRMVCGNEVDQAKNPFTGFGGFNSASLTSTPASASSPFSFLTKIPEVNSKKTNGEVKTNESKKSDMEEYYSKIKSLNTAFVDWIKSNVAENALCDLTPVFKDYEKYLKEFESLKNKTNKTDKESANNTSMFSFEKPSSTVPSQMNPISSNIFSSSSTSDLVKKDSPIKSFSPENKGFSFASQASVLSSAPSFSFGLQKTSTSISNVPLFGSLTSSASTPFSFINVTQTKSSETTVVGNDEGEAEEEPPKNEFVPVVEDDSLYSKRCKVFVKTSTDYADRGVGTLFLKKVDDKTQLIVRADTNLGNILLNIIVSEGLPTSRLGKNNVMIVCVPTPESKPPPTPVLIRVKTSDEADELLKIIEKHKE